MNVNEVLGQARDAMSVKRVFGDPIEKNGVMLIPVARVMGGAGAGSGEDDDEQEAADGLPGKVAANSSGVGFGVMAGPAGAYVIKGDQVSWEPAVSIERLAIIGGFIAVFGMVTLRSIIRIVVQR